MTKRDPKFKVIVPLSNFTWSGKTFQIDDLYTIEKMDTIPDLAWCEDLLSKNDKDDIGRASHWLSFEQSSNDKLSPSEKVNIFLLALWIVLPTRVHVRFRFELPRESGNGQYCSAVRYYDQFQWIKTQAKDQIKTKNLQKLQGVIDSLQKIYTNPKRLWNSLVLTLKGCTTIDWQVAFICFSAAAEGILTYKEGTGITRRLATSFACLTKRTKNQRDTAYQKFCALYGIRSDIMHGRIVHSRMTDGKKLKELSRFSNLLRGLWKTILLSPSIMAEIEKCDAKREVWFNKIGEFEGRFPDFLENLRENLRDASQIS